MSPQEIKTQLESFKEGISALGIKALQSKIPIKIDDAAKLLKPFANLENAFDREIRKFATQNKLHE